MQIKAGFKKEWLLFTRTGKIIGVILAICAFAIFDPVMVKLTTVMTSMMKEMTETIIQTDTHTGDDADTASPNNQPLITASMITLSQDGTVNLTSDDITAVSTSAIDPPQMDSSEIEQQLQSSMDLLETVSSMYTKDYVFISTMAEFYSLSLLIILLVMMNAAGGEMKKRSTIIPNCSGLESFSYILPKFILYPIVVFVTTIVGTLIAYGMTNALFEGELDFMTCLGSGLLTGVYLVFMLVLMLTIGICTSKPGIATISVFIGSTLLPVILAALEIDSFNPFALRLVAQNMVMGEPGENFVLNVVISLAVTLVLCVVLYFLTGFVLKARKINNLGEMKPHF